MAGFLGPAGVKTLDSAGEIDFGSDKPLKIPIKL
jgi:hypothetical protein